jgi:hypothetical protein
MPIALIADKCASHIFHKHVDGTEEGKAEGRSSFSPAAKSRGNEMTALIRSMQAATTCLNGGKPVGKIPICKLRLWHFPLPGPRISTLRRHRRLQYAAFDRPWTKSPFIIFLLFIIFHNFLGFLTRIFSGGWIPHGPNAASSLLFPQRLY